MDDALNVTEKAPEDNSIYSEDYFPFNPITGTDFNSPGVIQLNIENQDEYFLPSKSWLEIEGKLIKHDDTRYLVGDSATLANNGILNCFSNIKYQLGGNEIESINHPGQATLMLGLLKYDASYSGLSQCWQPDDLAVLADNTGFQKRRGFIFNASAQPNNIGSFSFAVDLEHIFGFAEDYDKVVYGMRHSLQLNRKANDNDAIYRTAAAHAGKVEITKITLWMARVVPSFSESSRLNKLILDDKIILDSWFRVRQCAMVSVPVGSTSFTWNLGVKTEKPRYVIIGLQTAKDENQEQNAALFDHQNVTNMKVRINSEEFPPIDVNSSFPLNHIAGWYRRLKEFKSTFYGVDKMVSSTCVDAKTYKDLYPLFVFDVSRQNEKMGNSTVVDLSVMMTTATPVPANTNAFSLVISDRKIQFKVDGKRAVVLF